MRRKLQEWKRTHVREATSSKSSQSTESLLVEFLINRLGFPHGLDSMSIGGASVPPAALFVCILLLVQLSATKKQERALWFFGTV